MEGNIAQMILKIKSIKADKIFNRKSSEKEFEIFSQGSCDTYIR